jgi:tetratricopeptide (TPR) repeat protein/transglutaminase-like putative cysteine protease
MVAGRGDEYMARLWVLAAALAAAGTARAADTEPHIGPAGAWVKAPPVPTAVVAAKDGAAPAKLMMVDLENHFGPDGDEHYAEFVGKVLTPDGLSALGSLTAEWNPDIESLTINKLQIIRDGTVIDRLPIDKFITLRRETNLEKAMLDGRLTAAVQVTDLQVGDVVDFAYTVTRKDPIIQGKSEGEQPLVRGFSPSVLQYRDVWPSTKAIKWRATGQASKAQAQAGVDGTSVALSFEDFQAPSPPEGAPPRFGDVGHLEFSEFKDWSEVSSLLYPLFQKAATLSPTSTIQAEIAKIKQASDDPEVRANLALRLVQDRVRYLFVGMDNGNYDPAPADQTWSRRFGDCKGKTVLLLAVLKELGVQAEPVMVNTVVGDSLDGRLPKLQMFDHVLVRAWINGHAFWLDGTAAADRDVRTLSEPPYGWGLPVRESGAKLERMAGEPLVLPRGETIMWIDSSAGLDKAPSVRVESVLHGDFAVLFSRKVGALSRDEAQKGFMEAWSKNYSWVDIQSVDWVFDVNAGEFRFWMTGAGKPGAWGVDNQTGSQVFEIDGSAFAKPKPLARPAGQDQQAPFAVDFPGYERSVTVVKLPNGGDGFSLVGDNFEGAINGVDYRRVTRFEHGEVVMERSTRAVTSEIGAVEARLGNARLEGFDTASAWIRSPLAVAKAPRDGDSLVTRGYDLLNQGHPDQALALFDQALAANPANVAARVGRADVFADRGDFDAAIHEYERAAQTSTDPTVALGRGGVLFAAGRFDQAVQVYSEALARQPLPALYRARAEALAAQDQLDRAMQDAEAAIKAAPNDPDGYSLRAALHLGAREPAKAVEDFDHAVRLAPDDSDNLVGRGVAYAAMSQYDRAIAEFDEAARIDPAALRPLQARADANAKAGRFDVAIQDLDKALAIAPGSAVLLNTRCWIRAGWGQQLDLAAADCEAALKTDPKSAAFLDSRGLVNLRLGKLDAAIADYDAALSASPKQASSLYGRGLAKLRKGDASGAKADLAAAKAARAEVVQEFDRYGLKPS